MVQDMDTLTVTTASGSQFLLWEGNTVISRVSDHTMQNTEGFSVADDITGEDFILTRPIEVGSPLKGLVGAAFTPLITTKVMSVIVETEED